MAACQLRAVKSFTFSARYVSARASYVCVGVSLLVFISSFYLTLLPSPSIHQPISDGLLCSLVLFHYFPRPCPPSPCASPPHSPCFHSRYALPPPLHFVPELRLRARACRCDWRVIHPPCHRLVIFSLQLLRRLQFGNDLLHRPGCRRRPAVECEHRGQVCRTSLRVCLCRSMCCTRF